MTNETETPQENQSPEEKAAKIGRTGTILAALIGLIAISLQFIPIPGKAVLDKGQTEGIISEYLSDAADSIVQASIIKFLNDNKDLFIGPTGLSGMEDLPIGTILPWTSQYSRLEIPVGWKIANGSNDETPDLRDRFIKGDDMGDVGRLSKDNFGRINNGSQRDIDIYFYSVVFIIKTE